MVGLLILKQPVYNQPIRLIPLSGISPTLDLLYRGVKPLLQKNILVVSQYSG